MNQVRTRREFLAAIGMGAAAIVAGCGGASRSGDAASDAPTESASPPASPGRSSAPTTAVSATPGLTPTPTPRPAGLETRALMAGSAWETPALIRSSGVPGPTVVVLGGVHGNEPGGWMAAEEVSKWVPAAGIIAVIPRANQRAIAGFLRLVDGEGDLNRLYPGEVSAELPMSRMAAEITALAHELRPDLLLDLHESWAFYADRAATGSSGTALLGQTVTGGEGPMGQEIAWKLAALVNASLSQEREMLIPREGTAFRRNDTLPAATNRGRSSLSLGGHIPGLTPVLVEMAQEGQAIERRVELHLAVVRAALNVLAM